MIFFIEDWLLWLTNKFLSHDFRLLCLQAQLIAQSIGQAFSVAYQEFLRANGINPEDLSQKEYSDIINTQEMYNDDLIHFSNSENCKEVGPYEVCSRCINFLQLLRFFLSLLFVGVLSVPEKKQHTLHVWHTCTHAAGPL